MWVYLNTLWVITVTRESSPKAPLFFLGLLLTSLQFLTLQRAIDSLVESKKINNGGSYLTKCSFKNLSALPLCPEFPIASCCTSMPVKGMLLLVWFCFEQIFLSPFYSKTFFDGCDRNLKAVVFIYVLTNLFFKLLEWSFALLWGVINYVVWICVVLESANSLLAQWSCGKRQRSLIMVPVNAVLVKNLSVSTETPIIQDFWAIYKYLLW